MSLIKTYLLQQEAMEQAKLELLEYAMFGSLTPIKYDYYHRKETSSSKKTKANG